MGHFGLAKNVPFETGQSVWPEKIMQQPVAVQSFVHHTQAGMIPLCEEPLSQLIRPAMISAYSGPVAICSRVTKRDNDT